MSGLAKLKVSALIVGGLAVGAWIVPQEAGASCAECVHDDAITGCLLGCPVDDPNCIRIEDCEVTGPGRCSGSNFCGGFAANGEVLLPNGVLLARSSGGHESLGQTGKYLRLESKDGTVVYRRSCDAVIVSRDYAAGVEASLVRNAMSFAI